jgi:chromosome segregation ATPase
MMSDFDSLREQLAAVRTQRDSAQREMASASEQLDRLKRDYAYLSRAADPQNGAQQEQLRALETRIEQAERLFERRKAGLADVSISASGIYEQFSTFTDPRQMIGQLQDRYPILLMLQIDRRAHPVRAAAPAALGARLSRRLLD